MSNRLPIPGSDSGAWGAILNSFLEVSLYNNTNNGSDPSNGTLNSNTVGTAQIQNNAITNIQLDVPTQTTLATVASKYTKPPGGIPASDLAGNIPITALSTAGTASSTTYLNGAGTWVTPAAGVALDSTSTDIQSDTTSGTASAGSSSYASRADHQHALAYHDHSTNDKGGNIPESSVSDLTTDLANRLQLGGDIGGTTTSPTIAKLQGTTLSAPSGGTTSYLNATGGWSTPAGTGVTSVTVNGGSAQTGAVSVVALQLAGDITGGSVSAPQVTGTHLSSALPVNQGGTGAATLTGLLLGNGTSAVSTITAPSGAIVGTSDTQTLTNKNLASGTNTFPTFNQNTTGNAATATTATTASTVTTNANLTGDVTSVGNATTLAKLQGTTLSAPSGGATSYLNATGNWSTPLHRRSPRLNLY
jgi:hypothetical protein